MFKPLSMKDHGVIFRNLRPGHVVVNAFLPFVHVVSPGHWLALLRVGQAFYSQDGMIELFESRDAGATWKRRGPVCSRAGDAGQFNYREACMTTLPGAGGRLLIRLTRVRHDREEDSLFNPATRGMLPRQTCFLTSDDAGATWSPPVVADMGDAFGEGVEPVPAGATIVLADGRWFQAFETWKTYDNAGPFYLQTYGLFSRDGGRTWDDRVTLADGQAADRSYSHGRPIVLADGRILIVFWTADAQQTRFFDLHAVWSTDGSATRWEQPRALGIAGQTNWPVDLGGGRVLLAYCHRENTKQPGIKAVLSEDGGRTWDMCEPLVIWDAYGREALGVAATSTYPSSHDTIAYGAPQVTRLSEGEAVVSFWCTLGPDTHGRWGRVKIESPRATEGTWLQGVAPSPPFDKLRASLPSLRGRGGRGVVAAALTVCKGVGEVDGEGMTRYVKALMANGCDGVFVCGSTGEMPFLDEDDRQVLIAAAAAGRAAGGTIYAGVSGTGLKQTLRYAKQAGDAGADVAVVMAPFFLKLSQEELAAFVLGIAECSPIPIAIYHHLRMPTAFEVDTVARLAGHENIVAMKDTSRDLQRLKDLVAATRGRDVAVFQGNEPLILSSLEAGADGCVSALAGVAPRWHAELDRAWRKGDHDAAGRWQERIVELWKLFQIEAVSRSIGGFVGALRVAAERRGWMDCTAGMLPGFVVDETLRCAVLAHLSAVEFDE